MQTPAVNKPQPARYTENDTPTTADRHIGSMRLMCPGGDVTLAWDEDSEERMIATIQKKMDEGMSFFVVQPRLGGIIPAKRTKVTKRTDLSKFNAVVVSDADFADLITSNAVTASSSSGPIETTHRAETAKEVARSNTVATRPLKGG